MADKKKKPNPIDIHVGSRVRLKRTMMGLSQERLGDKLGVTFQQVQKYEKGTNRIGASRLQQISSILNAPVSFFFDGAPGPSGGATQGFSETAGGDYTMDFLSTSEGIQLNRAFAKIQSGKVRKRVVDLVKALSENDE